MCLRDLSTYMDAEMALEWHRGEVECRERVSGTGLTLV